MHVVSGRLLDCPLFRVEDPLKMLRRHIHDTRLANATTSTSEYSKDLVFFK